MAPCDGSGFCAVFIDVYSGLLMDGILGIYGVCKDIAFLEIIEIVYAKRCE